VENARSGGAIAMFKLQYAEVLKMYFGPTGDDLLNRIERSKYPFELYAFFGVSLPEMTSFS
jgi:hypothetical protein